MTQANLFPTYQTKKKSGMGWGKKLLIGLGVGILASIVLVKVYEKEILRYVFTLNLTQKTSGQFQGLEMTESERTAAMAEIEYLCSRIRAGALDNKEVAERVMPRVWDVLFAIGIDRGAGRIYLEPSGLSSEEKSAGRVAFNRFGRAVIHVAQPTEIEKRVAELMIEQRPDEEGTLRPMPKERLTDDELRELTSVMSAAADQAGISPVHVPFDPATALRSAIDAGLQPAAEALGTSSVTKEPGVGEDLESTGGTGTESASEEKHGTS